MRATAVLNGHQFAVDVEPFRPSEERWVSGPLGMLIEIERLDRFQRLGAPCFEPPATDEDWQFLFGADPEDSYQP
jgi:hypothetical protein